MSDEQKHSPSITETIDAIFATCCARYGTAYFLARWEGQKLSVVKSDWARVLDGLERNQRAVRYALDNLPDKPPMAHEFRRLASNCPEPRHACLEWSPKPDPRRVAEIAAKADSVRKQPPSDPLEVAKGLRAREESGEKLTMGQKDFWRRVLAPKKALAARPGNERSPA